MKKLNKKGFTLIELMAVVIILIVVIFIAITRISKNVEDTENNTVIANAGSYIKAVNSFIQVESLTDPVYANGLFTVPQLNSMGVNLSGTKPEDGKLIVNNSEVITACLTYNGQYVILNDGEISKPQEGNCDSVNFEVFDFKYTGEYQEFVAPTKGKYRVELWGGSGYSTAYGAYTTGVVELEAGDKLYVYVGGKTYTTTNTKRFNAGTSNSGGYSGAGATDVRYFLDTPTSEDLEWDSFNGRKARVMVAAGGGSGSGGVAGAGGGLTGYSGNGTGGGTQTSFAGVQNSAYTASAFGIANGGCSGGNGYYPGGGANCGSGAGGGSSFISGFIGCNAIDEESTSSNIIHTGSPEHFTGLIFYQANMIDGKGCVWSSGSATNCGTNQTQPDGTKAVGHSGDGYARITLLSDYDPLEHLTIYYNNGNINKALNTECDLCSDPPTFGADRITLGTGYYGNFYTDPVDLSLYNSLIFKRTNGLSDRIYFAQTPQYANNGGEGFNVYSVTTTDLGNDYYVMDLSGQTRSDLRFVMNHYYSAGSGDVFYIAFSTKKAEDIIADHSFLP